MTEKEWLRTVADDARNLRETFETSPLVAGQEIAWSTRAYMGRMNGLSPIHRVRLLANGETETLCEEEIPAPIMWLELGPGWHDVLGLCGICARKFHAQSLVHAA